MIKFLPSVIILMLLITATGTMAREQDQNSSVLTVQSAGRYQQADLSPGTPCNCSEKTDRYYEIYRGVEESDIRNYNLLAYRFSLGESPMSASKLFRALETDPAVYKISIKEWDSFLLFTTPDFDKVSFDQAARSVLPVFEPIPAEEYFKNKNAGLYNMYRQVFPGQENISSHSNE